MHTGKLFFAGLAASALTALSHAQGIGSTASLEEAEIVTLSPFEVSSNNPARYQAAESAAGGRIATSIMDSPTTVTVLTSDFLSDIGGTRVLDAAKYVAGVGEATLPNSLDRIMIRGFQTDGRRVDGFSTIDQANYDHGAIDRFEVVKGPDAVLHPVGTPGGTINLVTKKPQWTYGGSIKLQVGEYDANRVEADVTGPLSERFAYRAIVAVQDSKSYIQDSFRESYLITPSLTWRITPQNNLTLRYEYYEWWGTNVPGLPVDPSVGTNDPFKVLQGVPRNFNPNLDRKYNFRHVRAHTGTALFTAQVTDRLSVRLAGRVTHSDSPNSEMRWGLSAPGGQRSPFTGEWVAGTMWTNVSADPANPDWQPSPAPQPTSIVTHTGSKQDMVLRLQDLQNDWSYIIDADQVRATTVIGFAYGKESDLRQRTVQIGQPFDYLNFQKARPAPVLLSPNTDRVRKLTRYQVYATQQLELFEKRLIVSGGTAHLTYNGIYGNKLAAAVLPPNPNPSVAGQLFPASGGKFTYNYGVVVKPTPSLSLYYGHTENAAPPRDFQQVAQGRSPVFSEGSQDELGLKFSGWGGRIIASVAYYEVEQTGYSITDPRNIDSPPPPVALPPLVVSRKGDGWEFQVTGSITPSLSLMASYADTSNRDPNGVMLVSSAENLASGFIHYEVQKGALKGFAVAVGANYLSKRAVETASGFARASKPSAPIPNQPSAYLPARTLADLTFTYGHGQWSYGLTVSNLFDKEYYAGADNRNLIAVGTPRSISGSITWKF